LCYQNEGHGPFALTWLSHLGITVVKQSNSHYLWLKTVTDDSWGLRKVSKKIHCFCHFLAKILTKLLVAKFLVIIFASMNLLL